LLGCWTIQAAKVTATIDAWNKASLSGEVTAAMDVQFTSSAKSKGRVTANHSALLTLSGLPACTVQSITLYVSSNTDAGAAIIMAALADRTWLVAIGNYNQWPGMSSYSTLAQPLKGLTYPITIPDSASLSILIKGTTNSVTLDKIELDYTLPPPTAHTVTLQWFQQDGHLATAQLTESEPLAGITLPSINPVDSIINWADETWYWLGWSQQPLDTSTISPIYWEADDWYGPNRDVTFYALYTNTSTQILYSDSTFTSGEYALVHIDEADQPMMFALHGAWQSGRIKTHKLSLHKDEQDNWTWPLTTLDDAYRYLLTFEGDSVTIYHPQTKSWIGHSVAVSSTKKSKWGWQKTKHGTLCLCGNNTSSLVLTFQYDQLTKSFYAAYASEPIFPEFPYWYLYPTQTLPSASQVLFTTFSHCETSLPTTTAAPVPARKCLLPNGRMIIQTNHINYTLKGQPL